jgi:hypothetical protein
MKTFKEQLTEKANNKTYDISEQIDLIKLKMEAWAEEREFTIILIESKPGHRIALGSDRGPVYQTFIPQSCEPHIYMKLFTEALIELGFKEKEIVKGAGDDEYSYYYNLKVKW